MQISIFAIVIWVVIFGTMLWLQLSGRVNFIGAIVGVLVLGLALFFFVFMWTNSGANDNISLARYLPMNWYYNTVNHPKETVDKAQKKVIDLGKGTAKKVNETGQKLDKETGADKLASKVTDEVNGKSSSKVESKKSNYVEIGERGSDEDSNSAIGSINETSKIKLDDVEAYIKKNSTNLTTKDKKLLRGATSMLSNTVSGDNIKFYLKDNLLVIEPK